MRNDTASFQSLQELTAPERLHFCAQEIQRLTPPRNYRERVLVTVYRHLLETGLQRENVSLSVMPEQEALEAALFVAVENETIPVRTWSYRGYAIRQLHLLWRFVMRPKHPTLQHATVGGRLPADRQH